MLRPLRQHIIKSIWNKYHTDSLEMQNIHHALQHHNIHAQTLDHFAIIDLPSKSSGIPTLQHIFTSLGYQKRGSGYLPEKQNDFLWLAELDCEQWLAKDVLPQIVVADFRLEEMPTEIRHIIEKYTQYIKPAPLATIEQVALKAATGDHDAVLACTNQILSYLSGRDWPPPTLREYHLVKEFNELLAWVLVFGRRPNHFTLSIHHSKHFSSLSEFHHFIEEHTQLSLNYEGGAIKGGKSIGIEQGSTNGIIQTIALADGYIQIPTGFVEFIWRFSHTKPQTEASLWEDYFTGFIATHANKVIESLCVE